MYSFVLSISLVHMVGLKIFVHLVRWLLFDNCPKWVVVLVPLGSRSNGLPTVHSTGVAMGEGSRYHWYGLVFTN